mgnify:FL=1
MLHATFSVFFYSEGQLSVYPRYPRRSFSHVYKEVLTKCWRKKLMFTCREGRDMHYLYVHPMLCVHPMADAYWGLAVRLKSRAAKDEIALFSILDRVFAHEVLLRRMMNRQGVFFYERKNIKRYRKELCASLEEHFLSADLSTYELPACIDSSMEDVRHTLMLMRKPVYSKLDNIAQTLRENYQFNERLNGDANREKEKIKSIKSKLIKNYGEVGCGFITIFSLFVGLLMALLR